MQRHNWKSLCSATHFHFWKSQWNWEPTKTQRHVQQFVHHFWWSVRGEEYLVWELRWNAIYWNNSHHRFIHTGDHCGHFFTSYSFNLCHRNDQLHSQGATRDIHPYLWKWKCSSLWSRPVNNVCATYELYQHFNISFLEFLADLFLLDWYQMPNSFTLACGAKRGNFYVYNLV